MIHLFNDHFKIWLIILFFTGWYILKLRTVCLRCYFQVGYYRLLMIYCVFHILYQGSGHLHKQILVKGQSSEIFTSNFFHAWAPPKSLTRYLGSLERFCVAVHGGKSMLPYLTTPRITESIFAYQLLEFVFSIICSVELFFDDNTGYHFQFEFRYLRDSKQNSKGVLFRVRALDYSRVIR